MRCLPSLGRELEDRSESVSSAIERGAVEGARRIRDRASTGFFPSGPLKLCSTVSLPVVASLNTVPSPCTPPPYVVP